MKGQHILHDKLRRIAMLAVNVAKIVEADDIVALSKQAFGPAAQAAEKINCERLAAHAPVPSVSFPG